MVRDVALSPKNLEILEVMEMLEGIGRVAVIWKAGSRALNWLLIVLALQMAGGVARQRG